MRHAPSRAPSCPGAAVPELPRSRRPRRSGRARARAPVRPTSPSPSPSYARFGGAPVRRPSQRADATKRRSGRTFRPFRRTVRRVTICHAVRQTLRASPRATRGPAGCAEPGSRTPERPERPERPAPPAGPAVRRSAPPARRSPSAPAGRPAVRREPSGRTPPADPRSGPANGPRTDARGRAATLPAPPPPGAFLGLYRGRGGDPCQTLVERHVDDDLSPGGRRTVD